MKAFPTCHSFFFVIGVCAVLIIAVSRCTVSRNQAPDTPRQWFREGTGRTIVMLGGGMFGAAMFAPHAQELARDYEVIRIQTLNVQTAETGAEMPANYSVTDEVRAIRATLSRIGVSGPVDIVGSSFGALVALHFAVSYPEQVRTVMLFEPPAFWVLSKEDYERDSTLRQMRDLTMRLAPSIRPSDEEYFQFRCLLGECPLDIPDSSEAARAEWDFRRSAMRGLAAVPRHREDPKALRRLSCPVLLLTGSRSVPFHRRINELLAQKLSKVETAELQGTHTAPRTNKEDFLRQLRSFIASSK